MESATETKVKTPKVGKEPKVAPVPTVIKSKQLDLVGRHFVGEHLKPEKVKVTAKRATEILGFKPDAAAMVLIQAAVDELFKSLRDRCAKVISEAK